ncbi:hypothetical protein DERP_006237 [Dermatophagoides pteronyssinus]|uniref:Uncharacterized protein n=1 Tax=Dermatophagoides pteronyssinus TaxID=6956 RepID=A0ABQ8IXV8_DERPT|nr:hypothetical protein DERP_006237 [Dermatophagoides pteronyssinus]
MIVDYHNYRLDYDPVQLIIHKKTKNLKNILLESFLDAFLDAYFSQKRIYQMIQKRFLIFYVDVDNIDDIDYGNIWPQILNIFASFIRINGDV